MRIGFAFNQKPSPEDEPSGEPPSPASRLDDRLAEWDDAETITAVERALGLAGEVVRLEADAEFPARLREADPDIVFNIAEGLNGPSREAHVPAICEFYEYAYTGSGPLTLGLALEKRRAKEVFVANGVATPAWCVIDGPSPNGGPPGRGPWIVKPLHEGSSMGVSSASICAEPAEAFERAAEIADRYGQAALVESFLPGREFTVAILGHGPRARALPLVEIRFEALPDGAPAIYGWEAKWLWDTPEAGLDVHRCPAQVETPLRAAIEQTALSAHRALGCLDWSRVDVRLDESGTPHVLEVNPLPGINPDPAFHSAFPAAARAAGIGYDELILTVLGLALERQGSGK